MTRFFCKRGGFRNTRIAYIQFDGPTCHLISYTGTDFRRRNFCSLFDAVELVRGGLWIELAEAQALTLLHHKHQTRKAA
jgi:hypothetical protein